MLEYYIEQRIRKSERLFEEVNSASQTQMDAKRQTEGEDSIAKKWKANEAEQVELIEEVRSLPYETPKDSIVPHDNYGAYEPVKPSNDLHVHQSLVNAMLYVIKYVRPL